MPYRPRRHAAIARKYPRESHFMSSRPRVSNIIPAAWWSCTAVMLMTLTPGLCALAATAPGTTATTAPAPPAPAASVAIDLSTPKSAAKTLFHGIAQGDRAAVAAVLYAANPQQQALADATV